MTDEIARVIADLFVAARNSEGLVPIADDFSVRTAALSLTEREHVFDWLPLWAQREIDPQRFPSHSQTETATASTTGLLSAFEPVSEPGNGLSGDIREGEAA